MNLSYTNNFIQKINLNFFWNEFNKTKIPQKYSCLGKKIRSRQISRKEYRLIVNTYFDIFYSELYYLNRPSYFFLGGFIENKRTTPGLRNNLNVPGNKKRHVEFPMSLDWSDVFFLNHKRKQIVYKKSKGTGTKTNKIEKDWLSRNNYYKLKPV